MSQAKRPAVSAPSPACNFAGSLPAATDGLLAQPRPAEPPHPHRLKRRVRFGNHAAIGARAGGRHDLPLLARSLAEWPLGETVRYKALLLEFARTFGMALPRSGDPA